jgi:hypothetical protein
MKPRQLKTIMVVTLSMFLTACPDPPKGSNSNLVAPPKPSVAIVSPSNSVDVTERSNKSVSFLVKGVSSDIFSDNRLRIYVLVHSGTEWHVQKPASVQQNGDWELAQAWIGDISAPIREGSKLRIVAVASEGSYQQDKKVSDYRVELNAVATSPEVVVTVGTVHRVP